MQFVVFLFAKRKWKLRNGRRQVKQLIGCVFGETEAARAGEECKLIARNIKRNKCKSQISPGIFGSLTVSWQRYICICKGSATPNAQTSSGYCSKCPSRGFTLHVFCIKIKHIRIKYFQSSCQTKHKNNADGWESLMLFDMPKTGRGLQQPTTKYKIYS